MSGVEAVGLVLGAFPILISLIDCAAKSRQHAGQFWHFGRAYVKQRNAVRHCQTLFQLHLHEFLQPLLAEEVVDLEEYNRLLDDPGGKGWADEAVQQALSERLQGTHGQYLDTLSELRFVLGRLLDKWKISDVKFKKYLDGSKSADQGLMAKATEIREVMALQPRKASHVLATMRREQLVEEAETYIKRLQDQLAAVERILHCERISPKRRSVPKAMLGYWRHASTVYTLLSESLGCSCCSEHQARLMLSQTSMAQTDLKLQLLFASTADAQRKQCRRARDLSIVMQVPDMACSCEFGNANLGEVCAQPLTTPVSPQIFIQGLGQSTDSSQSQSVPHSVNPGTGRAPRLCAEVALPLTKASRCLGFLQAHGAVEQYHMRLVAGTEDISTASCSVTSGADRVKELPLVPRLAMAAMFVLACLRLHDTPWFAGEWTLDNPSIGWKAPGGAAGYSIEPCIVKSIAESTRKCKSDEKAQAELWNLGVLLLELAYGRQLDEHSMWQSHERQRDRTDPVLRRAVAQEWVKSIELQVPGHDYQGAVQWCLVHSKPDDGQANDWRKDFAQHVVVPLQQYLR